MPAVATAEMSRIGLTLRPLPRPRSRVTLPRLALCTLLAFAALAAPYQATADAQTLADPDYWTQTAEHRDTVYRLVYSQSPQTIPPGYDLVREAEEILRQQQTTLPPSNPQAPRLWQQIRGVTARSALSPGCARSARSVSPPARSTSAGRSAPA